MSGVFCTNNAQAPSLFSNVTLTSRWSYVETVSGNSALLQSNGIPFDWRSNGIAFDCRRALLPETVSTYDRLLVSVTLEKREGACALFVQKTPDIPCLQWINYWHTHTHTHTQLCISLYSFTHLVAWGQCLPLLQDCIWTTCPKAVPTCAEDPCPSILVELRPVSPRHFRTWFWFHEDLDCWEERQVLLGPHAVTNVPVSTIDLQLAQQCRRYLHPLSPSASLPPVSCQTQLKEEEWMREREKENKPVTLTRFTYESRQYVL